MITLNDIKVYENEIIENYKHLHQIPEIGFSEFETSKFIQSKLDEYNVDYRVVAKTGIIADIISDPSKKTLAFRADMDALPINENTSLEYKSKNKGMMHACGHDAHVSMLLGAIKYFSENQNKIDGNLRFIFQPSEEGIPEENYEELINSGINPEGGAASMIDEGAIENVDGIFAIHVTPGLEIGKIQIAKNKAMASSDRFNLEIMGKGGHGAMPEAAIDPTGALSAIIAAYNQLPSREFSGLNNIVVSIGSINVEGTWNAIPDKVIMSGTYRTFNNDLRDLIAQRLEELAINISKAYRCEANFKRTPSCFATINNEKFVNLIETTANIVFNQEIKDMFAPPVMGAEDVGAYFNQIPGALAWLGIDMNDNKTYSLHNPNIVFNIEGLIYGSLLHINVAKNFFKGE